METLLRRLEWAVSTMPDARGWLLSAALLCVCAALALPIGFRSGFLRRETATLPVRQRIKLLLLTFFFPAMAEEIVFRVLLIPHPAGEAAWSLTPRGLWVGISLFAFVLSHLLNAALTNSPARAAAFRHPAFIAMATILGTACTGAYLATGSLWPPVLLHWIAVAAWLTRFGGYRRLGSP